MFIFASVARRWVFPGTLVLALAIPLGRACRGVAPAPPPAFAATPPAPWQQVARVGGIVRAVAAEGDRVFAALGSRVLVLRPNADGGIELLGQSPPLPDVPRVLEAHGDRLYVGSDGMGLLTLNVADPSAITVESTVRVTGRWTALARSGGRLAAILGQELVVFDCTVRPPIELGRAAPEAMFGYVPKALAWAGQRLAISASGGGKGNGGFGVVDVTSPSHPVLRGWVEDENPRVIVARDDRLAVTIIDTFDTGNGERTTGTFVATYRITPAGDVAPLGRTLLGAFDGLVDMAFDGDQLYLGDARGSMVIAVHAPGDGPPAVRSRWQSDSVAIDPLAPGAVVHSVAAVNGHVYVPQSPVAAHDGHCAGPGVVALSLDGAERLLPVGVWATADTGSATLVAAVGTTAFVANPGCGLRVYDVADPLAPTALDAWWAGRGTGSLDFAGYSPSRMVVAGDRLYTLDDVEVSGRNVLRILDARRTPLEQLAAIELPSPSALAVSGRSLLVAGRGSGTDVPNAWLRVYDVDDPAAPVLVGKIEEELDAIVDIAAAGDGFFVAAARRRYYLVDVRRPSDPSIPSVLESDGAVRRVAVRSDGRILAALVTPRGSSPSTLGLLDVLSMSGTALHANGRLVEPLADRLFSDGWGIALGDGHAFVAPNTGRVYEVDVDDPVRPRLLQSIVTGGDASDVAILGDVMLVADGAAGLALFERAMPSIDRTWRVYLPETFSRRSTRRLLTR